jgi:hypothetical protein
MRRATSESGVSLWLLFEGVTKTTTQKFTKAARGTKLETGKRRISKFAQRKQVQIEKKWRKIRKSRKNTKIENLLSKNGPAKIRNFREICAPYNNLRTTTSQLHTQKGEPSTFIPLSHIFFATMSTADVIKTSEVKGAEFKGEHHHKGAQEVKGNEKAEGGLRSYYISKIQDLSIKKEEKQRNWERLRAQRNELNMRGKFSKSYYIFIH